MFRKFMDWVRRVLGKLINKSTIKEKLQIDVAVSGEMADAIDLWSKIYENKAPWLSSTVQSLNLGSAIAGEIARLVTIELKSEITGSPRAEYLQTQYQPVLDKLRQYCEYGCAKGGIVFKPYIDGKRIAVDAVHADRFFPTAFDGSGNITGAVFVERLTKGKKYYTRFERHNLFNRGYEITNAAYVSDVESMIGREADLAGIDEWASLEAHSIIQNIDTPLFAYFKAAQANTTDTDSPLGVSVYARAVDLLQEADKQYSRLLWEFEGGELAIDADVTMFQDVGKDKVVFPKGKERLFRTFRGLGGDTEEQLKTFSSALRDESFNNGLNTLLIRIEDNCGLARGTFSNPQGEARTATELKILKQRSYATVADNQKSLQAALEQLIYAMDVWTTLGKLAPAGDYEVSFKWDDSIIVDSEAEQLIRMQEVAAGILKPEEYIKWRYGITDDAKILEMMPAMNKLVE
ncbi:MAG: phage portal protein [Christensenella sp.]